VSHSATFQLIGQSNSIAVLKKEGLTQFTGFRAKLKNSIKLYVLKPKTSEKFATMRNTTLTVKYF